MTRMVIIGHSMCICSTTTMGGGPSWLAHRRLCRLGPGGKVPDQSSFSKNRHRHSRLRQSDTLRHMFEKVAGGCLYTHRTSVMDMSYPSRAAAGCGSATASSSPLHCVKDSRQGAGLRASIYSNDITLARTGCDHGFLPLNGGVVICMSVSEAVAIGLKGVGRACEACNEDAALVRVIVLR
jgi:hypothetical protein